MAIADMLSRILETWCVLMFQLSSVLVLLAGDGPLPDSSLVNCEVVSVFGAASAESPAAVWELLGWVSSGLGCDTVIRFRSSSKRHFYPVFYTVSHIFCPIYQNCIIITPSPFNTTQIVLG